MTIMNQHPQSLEGSQGWDSIVKRLGTREWVGGIGTCAYVGLGMMLREGLLTTAGLSVLMWLQVLRHRGDQSRQVEVLSHQSSVLSVLLRRTEQLQSTTQSLKAGLTPTVVETNEMRSLISQVQGLTRQVAKVSVSLPRSGDEALLRSLVAQVEALGSKFEPTEDRALLRSLVEQVEGVQRQSEQMQVLLAAQSQVGVVMRTEPLVGRGRVCILVDEANISFPMLQQGKRLNFRTLLSHLRGDAVLDKAIIFLGRTPGAERQRDFRRYLMSLGFTLNTKDTIRRNDGSAKANFDVEMTLQMIQRLPHYETLVLVSGDGDFAAALGQVQALGRRVEVVSWARQTSHCLKEVADQFTALEDWEEYITRF